MIIVGAGGFGRELLETTLNLTTPPEILFFDDTPQRRQLIYDRFKVIGSLEEARHHYLNDSSFIVAVGAPKARELLTESHIRVGGQPQIILSPHANIGKFEISIGEGTCIMAGTILTTAISIGAGCLVNINCTIGHDCKIGDFTVISPGCHLSGGVTIGSRCDIGTGAVILPRVTIGDDVTIGAGAVVTKDLPNSVTAVGIPARPLHS